MLLSKAPMVGEGSRVVGDGKHNCGKWEAGGREIEGLRDVEGAIVGSGKQEEGNVRDVAGAIVGSVKQEEGKVRV